MTQKFYKYFLQAGIYLSFIIVFFVFKNLLFPYITSKQIPFNILMEFLLIFWVAYVAKYPSARPRKDFVMFGIAVFLAVLVVSSILGVDFNLSFWGDIERMLGVFHVIHFFIFYLIVITVFRNWTDWKILFTVSIIANFIVSAYGLAIGSDNGTLGNPLYLSGYIIFNVFFALLLFLKEKNAWLKYLYLLPIPFVLVEFWNTSSAGGWIGMAVGLFFAVFLFGILHENKKFKIVTVSVFLPIVIFGSYVFVIHRDNYLTNNVPVFTRIKEETSFEKSTFKTRLLSWNTAFLDFKSHPWLGTGFGNFAITFDKFFDAKFYSYTSSETYFDRAHNNLVDLLSTSGLLGLGTYLLIFVFAGYYLVRGYLKGRIGLKDFVMISSLIIAYFIQNLVVFDSFVTYLSLMMTLAYIYWNYHKEDFPAQDKDVEFNNSEILGLSVSGLILLTVLYQFNIKPFEMLVGTIDGQIAYQQFGLEQATDAYKKALSYNSVLDRDSRTSYLRLVTSDPDSLRKVGDRDKAEKILNYAIDLGDKNLKYNEHDSLQLMLQSQIYMNAATYYSNDPTKYEHYIGLALEMIDRSLEASPGRPPVYYQRAQILINMGEKDKAIETLKHAYDLNKDYPDSACNLARALLFYKDEKQAYSYMDICLDKNGASVLGPENLIKVLVNHYSEKNDYVRVSKLYERLTQLQPSASEYWIKLATVYKRIGEIDKAMAAATKAGEVDPKVKDAADNFIRDLQQQ